MSNCACDDRYCPGWPAVGMRECVECPGCGFTMAAGHAYFDDKYGCTECGHGDEPRGRSQRLDVINQRVRELIVRAVIEGRSGKVIIAGGLWRAACEDITWDEWPEAIADRLLASVDKPGESGGANPLP